MCIDAIALLNSMSTQSGPVYEIHEHPDHASQHLSFKQMEHACIKHGLFMQGDQFGDNLLFRHMQHQRAENQVGHMVP